MTGGRCCCVSVTVGRRCVAMGSRVWSTGMPVGSRAMVLPRSRAVTATVRWGAGGSAPGESIVNEWAQGHRDGRCSVRAARASEASGRGQRLRRMVLATVSCPRCPGRGGRSSAAGCGPMWRPAAGPGRQ